MVSSSLPPLLQKLREDILLMKRYLETCRGAQETRMLRQLEERQHFVENTHMYSLQDLIDAETGTLVAYLQRVHQSFSEHIKTSCLVRSWLRSCIVSLFHCLTFNILSLQCHNSVSLPPRSVRAKVTSVRYVTSARSSSPLMVVWWCATAAPLCSTTAATPPGGPSAQGVPARRPDAGRRQLKGRVVSNETRK